MEWSSARIRQLREVGLSLSQDEFATALGFAKRTVGNAERGTHPPSLALRRALDHAFEKASDAQRDRFLAVSAKDSGAIAPDNAPTSGILPGPSGSFSNLSWAISSGARKGITAETARDLLTISAHYRRAYHAMPAAALLEACHAHMSLVLGLQPALQSQPVRHLLLRAVG
jgi:DNA-binding XRE family transcriptional regulator